MKSQETKKTMKELTFTNEAKILNVISLIIDISMLHNQNTSNMQKFSD